MLKRGLLTSRNKQENEKITRIIYNLDKTFS